MTRRQWKIRLMKERVLRMQETSAVEVGGVLRKLIASSPKELACDLEEGLLVLLSGLMEVAGTRALGSVTSVLQALDAMPGDDWEEEDEESYYSDEEGDEEVNPDLEGRGIGECGRVQLSESLWRRAVPDDLLQKYREWMRTAGGVGDSKGVGVAEMLQSMVEGGSLRRVPKSMGASGKARVIPKNNEKCGFLMNCMKQNAFDCRPPPRFVLPRLEALRDCLLLRKRKRVYMIKFDVSNCYWSILMPKRWRDIFQVSISGQNYAWSSLPYGWKYSPVICQRLMGALAENYVFDLKVLPFTYLDDVLAAGARRDLKRAVRRLRGRLQRARFVVSPKSNLEPTMVLDFVGKILDTKRRRMENRKGMVTALLRSWLRLKLGLMRRNGFERFLGEVGVGFASVGRNCPVFGGGIQVEVVW